MPDAADLKNRPADSGEEALPLPTGTPLYEALTAKFIAFDRLLQTLAEVGGSGYIRLSAPSANGILLLRNGKVVDSLFRQGGQLRRGEAALAEIRRHVDEGSGVLDVVNLESALVDGLHHLASGQATYPELHASWVNGEGLVAFLQRQRFTGCLSVRAAAGGGVIMLSGGEVTGAFTTGSRELGPEPGPVLALCQDPEARIEVHGAPQHPSRPDERPTAVGQAVSEMIR